MIRFKPLPPIALTNIQPAFYDVESVTAIEMMSKFYSYLQELVNNYNEFVTEVNNEINNFEDDTNYKIDDFTCCIKKLVRHYIDTIDIRIGLQDTEIQNQRKDVDEAVDYMKNNIVETATEIINQAVENGDLFIDITYNEPTEELNIILSREDD